MVVCLEPPPVEIKVKKVWKKYAYAGAGRKCTLTAKTSASMETAGAVSMKKLTKNNMYKKIDDIIYYNPSMRKPTEGCWEEIALLGAVILLAAVLKIAGIW